MPDDLNEQIGENNSPPPVSRLKFYQRGKTSLGFYRSKILYLFLGLLSIFTSFMLGIIFTVFMTTHAFNDGLLKEIQRPILVASRIPADAHSQWLDLEQTFNYIDQFFYNRDKIDHTKMIWTAAEAAASALGDPFTLFRKPELAKIDQENLAARRQGGGLGVYLALKNKQLVLNQILPGNAAEKAGLQAGDVVLKINDTPVVLTGDDNKDLDALGKQLRGDIGTTVQISVRRANTSQIFDINITRAEVITPPVLTRLVGENQDTGYISVTTFGPDTIRQFDEKVSELEKSNPAYYVLDLRGNGGGLVDVAQKLLGRFLDGGVAFYRTIPYQQVNYQPENVINDQAGPKIFNKPLVVLINGGTASASEITAGALQNRLRAHLIGEKSFGKGLAQYVLDLPSKASVRITFEQWFTPNKIDLTQTKGLPPDIEIQNKQEDINSGRDPQLDRAISYLHNPEVPKNQPNPAGK